MSIRTSLLIAFVVILATAASFYSHVALQEWSTTWFTQNSEYMRSLEIIKQPYPTYVVVVAGLLQLLPVSAEFAFCALAWISIPLAHRSSKACVIVALFLLAHDVVRTDIMTLLMGNPLGVAFISRADSLVPKLLTALIFAIGLAIWNPTWKNADRQPRTSQ